MNPFNSYNSRPSIAYYEDDPQKVQRMRTLLQLGELGLSYLSIPAQIKNFASKFIRSHYVSQMISEGALVGYLESREEFELAQTIEEQNLNPF